MVSSETVDRVAGAVEEVVRVAGKSPRTAVKAGAAVTGLGVLLTFVYFAWLSPDQRMVRADAVRSEPRHEAPAAVTDATVQQIKDAINGLRDDVKSVKDELRSQSSRIDRVYEVVSRPR